MAKQAKTEKTKAAEKAALHSKLAAQAKGTKLGAEILAQHMDGLKKTVWKPLKSTDQRKAEAMAQLKVQSGCRKVTMVEISKDGSKIRGNCMNPNDSKSRTGILAVDFAATMGDAINDAAGRAAGIHVTDISAKDKDKDKTPARARPKLVIEDACAAAGCTNPPVQGASYCAEHTILAMKERIEEPAPPKMTKKEIKEAAKTTCLARGCLEIIPANAPHRRCPKHAEAFMAKAQKIVKKVEKEINAQLASPAGKALMAELTAPAAAAPAPVVDAKLPAGPRIEVMAFAAMAKPEQRKAAMELTRKLVAIGWSVNAQAAATGVTNGSVYRWYRASAAPTPGQFEALQQMLANPPPAAPTAAKGAAGSIKAPNARSQAAKATRAPRERDVRQLMLELRDALNAQLGAK